LSYEVEPSLLGPVWGSRRVRGGVAFPFLPATSKNGAEFSAADDVHGFDGQASPFEVAGKAEWIGRNEGTSFVGGRGPEGEFAAFAVHDEVDAPEGLGGDGEGEAGWTLGIDTFGVRTLALHRGSGPLWKFLGPCLRTRCGGGRHEQRALLPRERLHEQRSPGCFVLVLERRGLERGCRRWDPDVGESLSGVAF